MKFPDIAMFDSGVSKVRPSLPKTGVVGFYTDQPGNAGAPQEFYLTQYSIAPVLLENNVDHPLVIASIHTPESRVTNPNLKLVHDFNNGIQLFRNVTK